ncbi:MAG: preprotein translocase subunit SecG [Bacteroidales bacterium]|nr:preprotein translocase subunit SecG [Bacteroidales bacterium]
MYLFITILILIAALFMILIVLVQNSKGGGLAAGFSSSNQIMGVRKTTDFLEKATWGLAAVILFLSIISAAFIPKAQDMTDDAALKQQIEQKTTTTPGVVNPGFEATTPVKGDSAKK